MVKLHNTKPDASMSLDIKEPLLEDTEQHSEFHFVLFVCVFSPHVLRP